MTLITPSNVLDLAGSVQDFDDTVNDLDLSLKCPWCCRLCSRTMMTEWMTLICLWNVLDVAGSVQELWWHSEWPWFVLEMSLMSQALFKNCGDTVNDLDLSLKCPWCCRLCSRTTITQWMTLNCPWNVLDVAGSVQELRWHWVTLICPWHILDVAGFVQELWWHIEWPWFVLEMSLMLQALFKNCGDTVNDLDLFLKCRWGYRLCSVTTMTQWMTFICPWNVIDVAGSVQELLRHSEWPWFVLEMSLILQALFKNYDDTVNDLDLSLKCPWCYRLCSRTTMTQCWKAWSVMLSDLWVTQVMTHMRLVKDVPLKSSLDSFAGLNTGTTSRSLDLYYHSLITEVSKYVSK